MSNPTTLLFIVDSSFIPFLISGAYDTVEKRGVHIISLTDKHLKAFICFDAAFELATKGVGSKPSFAMEVLLSSTDEKITFTPKDTKPISTTFEFSNWNTPTYIREGLQWLKQG
ncbi:MAG: hypothetical protein H6937_02650 [Burkholderiales bacterium]|nr:hypothetical protein [Burkholderiales bacterium]